MSPRQQIVHLRNSVPGILPSLLLCDFGNLEREVQRLSESDIAGLHLDVMDGRFVPNLTYGMPIVAGLRKLTELPLDVHLMIEEPQRYVTQFADAGADCITFHAEAVSDVRQTAEQIKQTGCGVGVAINPGTPVDCLADSIELCDLALVMSVEAGFGGQQFQAQVLEKLGELRSLAGPDLLLEVDGGINRETIETAATAGAQLFVVGSAIFGQTDYVDAVQQLHASAFE